MVDYRQIEEDLELLELEPVPGDILQDSRLSTDYRNPETSLSEQLETAYVTTDNRAQESVLWRRGDERTSYTNIDGEHVAVKAYTQTPDTGELETPINEAEMLEAARNLGLDVAEPLTVTSDPENSYLFKRAGHPEDGEVPYWMTDFPTAVKNGSYTESEVESHLADSFNKTMEQLLTLREEGLIHTSISPLSHATNASWGVDEEFSVYGEQALIRELPREVNIAPTGELKDFEHVAESDYKPSHIPWNRNPDDGFGQPVAETVATYLWTASAAGLEDKTARDIITGSLDELTTDYNVELPDQRILEQASENIHWFRKGLTTDQKGREAFDSVPLRKVAQQITGDDVIVKDPNKLRRQRRKKKISMPKTISKETNQLSTRNGGKYKKSMMNDIYKDIKKSSSKGYGSSKNGYLDIGSKNYKI